VLFWRGVFEPFESVKATLLVIAAILLAALGLTPIPKPRLPRDLVGLGALLFVVSAAVSTVFSLSWRTSLWGANESQFGLITIASSGVLYFGTRAVCTTPIAARRLLGAVPVGAGIAGGYALLQWAGCDPFAWENQSVVGFHVRPFGTLGHPNILAGYLAMAVPLTLTRLRETLAARRWRAALGFAAIALIEVAAIFAAMSRAAWLALAVAVAVWVVGQKLARWRFLAIAIGLLGLSAILAVVFVEPFAERLRHIFDPSGRLFIWKAAWTIFTERPFFGCGPDAFHFAFAPHRTPEFWAVEWGATPNKAHNDLLHIVATQGLFGLLATALFVAGLVRSIRKSWRTESGLDRALAAVAGLAAFVVQGLFGFATIATAALAIAFAAILTAKSEERKAESEQRRAKSSSFWLSALRSPLFVLVVAIVLIGRVIVMPLAASWACREGLDQLAANPTDARAALDLAVERDPGNDLWWAKRSEAALQLGRLPQARESLETAIRLVPANGFHWHNLAQVRAEQAVRDRTSEPQAAFEAFDTALRIDPNNVYFSLDAARFALQMRDAVRAHRYIEVGLHGYPNFAPLVAERAFLALLEDRPEEALAWFDRALAADWVGDSLSEERAKSVKREVERRLAMQTQR
jgi:O-antigen ligase/Tfp pilus assembly protein PilF